MSPPPPAAGRPGATAPGRRPGLAFPLILVAAAFFVRFVPLPFTEGMSDLVLDGILLGGLVVVLLFAARQYAKHGATRELAGTLRRHRQHVQVQTHTRLDHARDVVSEFVEAGNEPATYLGLMRQHAPDPEQPPPLPDPPTVSQRRSAVPFGVRVLAAVALASAVAGLPAALLDLSVPGPVQGPAWFLLIVALAAPFFHSTVRGQRDPDSAIVYLVGGAGGGLLLYLVAVALGSPADAPFAWGPPAALAVLYMLRALFIGARWRSLPGRTAHDRRQALARRVRSGFHLLVAAGVGAVGLLTLDPLRALLEPLVALPPVHPTAWVGLWVTEAGLVVGGLALGPGLLALRGPLDALHARERATRAQYHSNIIQTLESSA